MLSFEIESDEQYIAEQEKAIKMFTTVIENAVDEKIKRSAIIGITQYLNFRGRKEEARKYAEIYPEIEMPKDQVLIHCLSGDEQKIHFQRMIMNRFNDLLHLVNTKSKKLEEVLLELFFPDKNYVDFHFPLFRFLKMQVDILLQEKRYDDAVVMMKRALFHAVEYDKIVTENKVHKYTAPLFDMLEYDPTKTQRSGTGTLSEEFYKWLENDLFDVIRERDDFKA